MTTKIEELPADLDSCASELIHLPGRIQPHGVLLALTEPALTIACASQGCEAVLGRSAASLLGQPIESLFGPAQLAAFRDYPQAEAILKRNPLLLKIDLSVGPRAFDGIIHRSGELLILELEPTKETAGPSFVNLYQQIHGAIAEIEVTRSLDELCQATAKEIRRLTGFDRVMIYQFGREWNGKVIAEDKAPQMAPFFGLHFPAGDIPQQARELYTRNWLRLIPDASYQSANLVSVKSLSPKGPLDLTFSVLRSVAPVHLEYLQNLGVQASMSISLIRDGVLWGLIACHHRTPRHLPFDLRLGCEFIGKFMSLQLAAKEKSEEATFRQQAKELQPVLLERMSKWHSGDFLEGLFTSRPGLQTLTNAAGAASVYHGECKRVGIAPDDAALRELARFLGKELRQDLFFTESLSTVYPEARGLSRVASGLIALRIPEPGDHYLFWFRPEVLQTVNWAGNPEKLQEPTAGPEFRLSPRKSFELWKETVQLRSLPWTAPEVEAAAELRRSLIDVDLLRQVLREREARAEAERSNQELDQFAYVVSHDLKEPLRGIGHYADFIIEDDFDKVSESSRTGLREIKLLAKRTQGLLTSLHQHSKVGRVDLSYAETNLNDIVGDVVSMMKAQIGLRNATVQVPRPLPQVFCDFVRIGEVFSNLISNALKYTVAPKPQIEVGYQDGPRPVLFVKDDGIGIPLQHQEAVFEMFRRLHGQDEFGGGSGSGLAISKRIVERHGGEIWIESEIGKGATFFFTLAPEATTHA